MTITMLLPALPLAIARTEIILAAARTRALHHRRSETSTREAAAPRSHSFSAYVFLEVLFSEIATLHIELELPDVPKTAYNAGAFGGYELRVRVAYNHVIMIMRFCEK